MFENAGWDVYFGRLKGWNEEIAMEFALNLEEGVSRVRGVEIPVIEKTIAEVSGLPQVKECWFSRRTPLLELLEAFLQAGEIIVHKGWGYDRTSLPNPWGGVSYVVIKYMTCEGRYYTIFKYHLCILAHLRFPQAEDFSTNVPYFLLRSLHLMENLARGSRQVLAVLSHHGLV